MDIVSIFPTPVGLFTYPEEFTKKELEYIKGLEQRPNMGNKTSLDNYVLKNSKLKNIASFIQVSVDQYFDEVYRPKEDVKLYVTQSWFNFTKPGEWHHKHEHPNSFVSGVLYINANPEKDKIYFYHSKYKQLNVTARDWNLWNSDSWWFHAGTAQLVLFPSSLTHMVETVEEDDTRDERISLSFNTFLKGYVGDEQSLTGLRL